MKLLLDTNRYRDFCAADPLTKEILQQADRIRIKDKAEIGKAVTQHQTFNIQNPVGDDVRSL